MIYPYFFFIHLKYTSVYMTSMDLATIKNCFFLFKVGGGTCLIETHQELLIAQEIHSCVKTSPWSKCHHLDGSPAFLSLLLKSKGVTFKRQQK